MKASTKITALLTFVATVASTVFPPTAGDEPLINAPIDRAAAVLEAWAAAPVENPAAVGPHPAPTEPVRGSNPGAAHNSGLDEYGIYGAGPDQQAQIKEALHLFGRAGLTLPELRIYVHETDEPCHGYLGLYGEGGDKHRIDLCMSHPFVIRHELAHAWEYHGLDDLRRQAFLDRVGIEEWNDLGQPRQLRGMEHVADLIAWGIDDPPIQVMHRNVYAEDLDTYELLTGRPSPRVSHWDEAPARARDVGAPTGPPIPVAAKSAERPSIAR